MIEIKVTFLTIDPDDNTMEIWHDQPVKGKANDYGREVYGEKRWFNLTDDHIKIYPFPEDVVFVICDKDFNVIAKESNDRAIYPIPFPTLYEQVQDVWKGLQPKFPEVTPNHWYNWIFSYANKEMNSTEKSNWFDYQRNLLKTEELSKFEYLGHKYCIIRHRFKHTECPATWYEYFASPAHLVKSGPYLKFFGYLWDKNIVCEEFAYIPPLFLPLSEVTLLTINGEHDGIIEDICNIPFVRKQLNKLDKELLKEQIKLYDIWNDHNPGNHKLNLHRIVWHAATNIIDQLTDEQIREHIPR